MLANRFQGKPIHQKEYVLIANAEGRDLSPGTHPPSTGLAFFSCRAPLLRVALWPQLTIFNDVFDDVLAP